MLAAALDAVVAVDQDGLVVEFNPAAEAMFGYTRAEAIHQQVSRLVIPARLRPAHRSGLRRLASGGEPRILDQRVELTAIRKDGTEFPVELNVTRSGSDPVRYTAWIKDLRRRRAAESLAARQTALLRHAERVAGIGSWSWKPGSGDIVWSDNMFRLFGLQPGAIVPTVARFVELTHPDDREHVQRAIARADQGAELPAIALRIVRRDGSVRHLRVLAAAETTSDGEPREIVGTVLDVTETRRAEREIAAHCAVTDVLGSWECFETGAERLLRALGVTLDCDVATLWVPHEGVLIPRIFWSTPSLDSAPFERETHTLRLPCGADLPGLAWQSRAPIGRFGPGAHHGAVRELAAMRTGITSTIAFPALLGEEVLAVVELHSTAPVELGDRLVRSLTGIGHELGVFLARRRGELQPPRLTPRQLEILQLAAGGLSGPEIAQRLFVSPATVKTHFQNIYESLGVPDRASAVAQALREGLIE